MQHVTLIRNPLEPGSWERVEVPDVREFLMAEFEVWPASARIYAGVPSQDRDVTPGSESDVERLTSYPDLTVVVYPGDPITILIVVGAIILGVVAAMFLMPHVPSLENQTAQSPNNGLAARTNRPRPNARIPDIFGTVRSIPDLIALPYRVYDDHRELEIAYMCLGRGAHDVADVRDGETLVEDIDLASCEVWAPYTSPNDGSLPQLLIGEAIGDPLFRVRKSNEVNGQTMKADNDKTLRTSEDLTFSDGGVVQSAGGVIDFTDYFQAGDYVDIGRAQDPGGPTGSTAVMAAATANSGGFDFASYDPTADWSAGDFISITYAVFQVDDATSGSGDIAGSTDYPDYPYNPYDQRCVTDDSILLLPGGAELVAGKAEPGMLVWTPDEHGRWGAFPITAVTFALREACSIPGYPDASLRHRFGLPLPWWFVRMLPRRWRWFRAHWFGRRLGLRVVVQLTVEGAHTYMARHPSVGSPWRWSHNIKATP